MPSRFHEGAIIGHVDDFGLASNYDIYAMEADLNLHRMEAEKPQARKTGGSGLLPDRNGTPPG
jgi:hypothetical protein